MQGRKGFGARAGTKRLVIVGDSLAYADDKGPQLPGAPGLYPSVVAEILSNATGEDWSVSVVARAGADVRDAWAWLSKDRHVQFELVAPADAVILGIGSFDHSPMGVPKWLETLLAYVRPSSLRRSLKAATARAYPRVVRASRSRWVRTSPAEFERLYSLLLRQIIGLTQGEAPIVAMGPTSHRSNYYGEGHPRLAERTRHQMSVAESFGVPSVACWPLVEPHADNLNVDGIHWPYAAHAAVGGSLARVLLDQLQGRRPLPAEVE